ncbi:MAG: carboxymuconolactone decarboxylase family protein [Pirellulales bacterium]
MPATPALDALRETLPDDLKDLRLNLTSVLGGENLSTEQAFGVAIAAAHFDRCPRLAEALVADLQAACPESARGIISDAIAAAGLMGMNTVYYRFRHMVGKESYASRPARLRMTRIAQPTSDKATFELMSLGCAAMAGCEACIQNHEGSLVKLGVSEDACHDAVRIAAVIRGGIIGLN